MKKPNQFSLKVQKITIAKLNAHSSASAQKGSGYTCSLPNDTTTTTTTVCTEIF